MVTKHKAAGLALLLALGLAAYQEADAGDGRLERAEYGDGVAVITDMKTGCSYITTGPAYSSYTPLLNAQGEPDCGNVGGVSE